MGHPFDLDPAELAALDLDFEQQLTDEEATQVGGGRLMVTTLALGEEGGCWPQPQPEPIPIDPPITTKALGEEGGITKAFWEDGEGPPITTMAEGEEGGYITQSCAETGCDSGIMDMTW